MWSRSAVIKWTFLAILFVVGMLWVNRWLNKEIDSIQARQEVQKLQTVYTPPVKTQAHKITIDPKNDPLAPIRPRISKDVAPSSSSSPSTLPEKPIYESPNENPVLLQ